MEEEVKTVIMKKEFKAPRERVWKALTDSEQLKQWWSPDHFTIPECELEVWPEGKMKIVMQGPDGTKYPTAGRYKEVREPEMLSYTNTPLSSDGTELFEVLQTIELEESDGGTVLRLTAEVLWATDEAAPYLSGMEEGLRQATNKLGVLVEQS